MDAGRELDAKVAERLGIEVERDPRLREFYLKGHIQWSDIGYGECYRPMFGDESKIKDYSTSIAAAWELVEHMGDMMKRLLWNKGSGKWECILDYDHVGVVPTAPHAICLAFLKAAEPA